jgi:hypothetical protein
MNGFRNYLLSKGIASEKSVNFYQMWVFKFLNYQKSSGKSSSEVDTIDQFISTLSKNYADWQLNQANEAIRAYFIFKARETTPHEPNTAPPQ